jgi:hypothetical protein
MELLETRALLEAEDSRPTISPISSDLLLVSLPIEHILQSH